MALLNWLNMIILIKVFISLKHPKMNIQRKRNSSFRIWKFNFAQNKQKEGKIHKTIGSKNCELVEKKVFFFCLLET